MADERISAGAAMWVSPVVLGWEPWFLSGRDTDDERWRRPYEIHAHAEKLVLEAKTPLTIADAVVNLRRALDLRSKHLEEMYGFKGIFRETPGILERLEAVGLVRPLLLRQLIDLRNSIEHQDAQPPGVDRCRELADATWYFLRSTDPAAKILPDGVQLSPPGGGPKSNGQLAFFEVQTKGTKSGEYRVRGWLQDSLLSTQERPLWLQLSIESIRTKYDFPHVRALLEEMKTKNVNASDYLQTAEFRALQNVHRSDDERFIEAIWKTSAEHRKSICKMMLESI